MCDYSGACLLLMFGLVFGWTSLFGPLQQLVFSKFADSFWEENANKSILRCLALSALRTFPIFAVNVVHYLQHAKAFNSISQNVLSTVFYSTAIGKVTRGDYNIKAWRFLHEQSSTFYKINFFRSFPVRLVFTNYNSPPRLRRQAHVVFFFHPTSSQSSARHPHAAGNVRRRARQLAGAGTGADERLRYDVSGRAHPGGGHTGDPPQSAAVRGRTRAARLRREWRLGDIPGLRRPGTGHPRRLAPAAQMLARSLSARAERQRGLARPRAARVRERRAGQFARPVQVPASGLRNASHGGSGKDRARGTRFSENHGDIRRGNQKLLQETWLRARRAVHVEKFGLTSNWCLYISPKTRHVVLLRLFSRYQRVDNRIFPASVSEASAMHRRRVTVEFLLRVSMFVNALFNGTC